MSVVKYDTRVGRKGRGELHVHYRQHDHAESLPTVIFSHGFTVDGTESHRMFLGAASAYNNAGFNTINFDYYGCGYSDGESSEFSLSDAVADLETILQWAQAQPQIDPHQIVVHGQSLGTAVATVTASRRPGIRGFVMWNLSADLRRRYLAMLGEDILTAGHAWVRDKGYMIRRELIDDISQYDILAHFDESWTYPTLFITSGNDTTGEPALAEQACDSIGSYGHRIVIEGANHSFKCQPELERQAVEASVAWAKAELLPTT